MDGLLIPFYVKAMPSLPYFSPIRSSLRCITPPHANSNQQLKKRSYSIKPPPRRPVNMTGVLVLFCFVFPLSLSLLRPSPRPQGTNLISSYPQPPAQLSRARSLEPFFFFLPSPSLPFPSLSPYSAPSFLFSTYLTTDFISSFLLFNFN